MKSSIQLWSLPLLTLGSLASCSGSSSGDGTTVALAVTDASSEELSTFTIGVETVQLIRATGAPVDLLQRPTAVDFAALGSLSRILNVTAVPPDIYTGVDVELSFDPYRIYLNGATMRAALLDAEGAALTGPRTYPITFAVPFDVTSGDHVLELDLDLNQSVDVNVGSNEVYLEPTLLPRLDPILPKEHAVGGNLRTVVLASSLFRIGLDALPSDPQPVVTIKTDANTVFQVNGQCIVGLAGLSSVDLLAPGSWVQAFGTVDPETNYFEATTVEAGTGSYNGGSDIVEGLITGRAGDALTVRGHSNNSTHTIFEFNLNYTVNTVPGNTKTVRRGFGVNLGTNELNVGQRVRMFGQLNSGTNTLDVSTTTDVVRAEPTHIFGLAVAAPASNQVVIDVTRVDLRDVGVFNWAQGGLTPPDPDNLVVADPMNLSGGQGIAPGTPVEVVGFFTQTDDSGLYPTADFEASQIINRQLTASLLLVRDRVAGMTTTPTISATQIDFTFGGASAGLEKAVVDQGFVGETDVEGTGITMLPGALGLGLYTIRDRTLNTIGLYLTFDAFRQALDAKLMGGATLFNFSAFGSFDSGAGEITSALAGAVVQ